MGPWLSYYYRGEMDNSAKLMRIPIWQSIHQSLYKGKVYEGGMIFTDSQTQLNQFSILP